MGKDWGQEIQGGLSGMNRKTRLQKSTDSLHINGYSQQHKKP